MKNASIIITPDLCPIKRIDFLCKTNDFAAIYNDYIDVLKKADYRIVNLEAPITDFINPIKKTGPNLFVNSKHVEHLRFANFNLFTLANNHIMDQGEIGLHETLKTLRSNNMDYVGVGNTLEESREVFYTSVKGIKIGIINITENEFSISSDSLPGANPLDLINNSDKIREAKLIASYVFVIVHGGNEEYNLPSPRVQRTYRFFIDCGADAVVSHHTHCFSGYESYRNGHIFYSLGNFIFDKENSINKPWNFGFSVEFLLNEGGKVSFNLHPYKQCNGEQVGVYNLSKDEEANFYKEIFLLNAIISDPVKLNEKWKKLLFNRRNAYLNYIEPFNNIFVKGLRKFGLMPKLMGKRKRLLLLNLIRCEAHRDVLLGVLEDEKK